MEGSNPPDTPVPWSLAAPRVLRICSTESKKVLCFLYFLEIEPDIRRSPIHTQAGCITAPSSDGLCMQLVLTTACVCMGLLRISGSISKKYKKTSTFLDSVLQIRKNLGAPIDLGTGGRGGGGLQAAPQAERPPFGQGGVLILNPLDT